MRVLNATGTVRRAVGRDLRAQAPEITQHLRSRGSVWLQEPPLPRPRQGPFLADTLRCITNNSSQAAKLMMGTQLLLINLPVSAAARVSEAGQLGSRAVTGVSARLEQGGDCHVLCDSKPCKMLVQT